MKQPTRPVPAEGLRIGLAFTDRTLHIVEHVAIRTNEVTHNLRAVLAHTDPAIAIIDAINIPIVRIAGAITRHAAQCSREVADKTRGAASESTSGFNKLLASTEIINTDATIAVRGAVEAPTRVTITDGWYTAAVDCITNLSVGAPVVLAARHNSIKPITGIDARRAGIGRMCAGRHCRDTTV